MRSIREEEERREAERAKRTPKNSKEEGEDKMRIGGNYKMGKHIAELKQDPMDRVYKIRGKVFSVGKQ